MKLFVRWVEEYPVFYLETAKDAFYNQELEIPEALYERYQAARDEWKEVQHQLDLIVRTANKEKRNA